MIYFLYPQLRKLSGAERLILRLATYTTQRGAPVTVLTHYFDSSCRPALGVQVRLTETGERPTLSNNHYLNAPVEYLYSIRLLKHIGGDAEAITFFGPPSLPALYWSKRFSALSPRLPRLYFCYEPPRFAYDDTEAVVRRLGATGMLARPGFGVYKRLDRAMAQQADALLANSAFGAARLRAAYGRDATVITHGADFADPAPAQVDALRARYALQGKCVLLTVNFLHPRKRIDLLLRALPQIRASQPNTAAVIVGAGPEANALESLARELQIQDAVLFTGFVADEELPAYYAASDVYVHTGKLESFGLSVLEASAAGVPVVSVDEGGPREIIADGETGRLVAAQPDALAEAIVALFGDPAARARMGQTARARVAAHYSWERGAQEFLDVCQQMRNR